MLVGVGVGLAAYLWTFLAGYFPKRSFGAMLISSRCIFAAAVFFLTPEWPE
jgi:hypothetical protein